MIIIEVRDESSPVAVRGPTRARGTVEGMELAHVLTYSTVELLVHRSVQVRWKRIQ
jgi:hypothetical protein